MPDADFFKVNVIRDFSYFNIAKHKQQNIKEIVIQKFFSYPEQLLMYALCESL